MLSPCSLFYIEEFEIGGGDTIASGLSVLFSDPVAVRHSLEILSELATKDPYAVSMALGALQDVIRLNDVLARVALAKLCHSVSKANALDERPDIKSQFDPLICQLLLDPSGRVCLEAILCVVGIFENLESGEVLKLPNSSSLKDLTSEDKDSVPAKAKIDKSSKTRHPQPLIKLVMRRSFSRPILHAAARVVQEMGKTRAASFALGQYIDEGTEVNTFSESIDSYDADINPTAPSEGIRIVPSMSSGMAPKDTIASLLASLMDVVRTTAACECVYVRAMVIKVLIWMQSPHESFDELESIIASKLSDPSLLATVLLNDVLLTLHTRFKATPDMAVTLQEIARIFATKVPGMIDAAVLQLLWKVWFLGENANYAASDYVWESVTRPGTALMILDTDKMVLAASSRNPTLWCTDSTPKSWFMDHQILDDIPPESFIDFELRGNVDALLQCLPPLELCHLEWPFK
ncbi:SH3 domain-containing protein [Striga hermonthica]|uniref:SH3 domain-containing protein n=1 Tax=Striga hermonthica TaxID=68872 RepID=A0A9N7NT39_STRHE|nr:SH3 domain-containing protein [Striga hermonthica]